MRRLDHDEVKGPANVYFGAIHDPNFCSGPPGSGPSIGSQETTTPAVHWNDLGSTGILHGFRQRVVDNNLSCQPQVGQSASIEPRVTAPWYRLLRLHLGNTGEGRVDGRGVRPCTEFHRESYMSLLLKQQRPRLRRIRAFEFLNPEASYSRPFGISDGKSQICNLRSAI